MKFWVAYLILSGIWFFTLFSAFSKPVVSFSRQATTVNVDSLGPENNSTLVPVSTSLTIFFSESVHAGSGYIIIKKTSDDSPLDSIDVTSGQVVINDSIVTISPSADLPDSMQLYILIDSAAFTAASGGTAYLGISDKAEWTFFTDHDSDGDGAYSSVDCNDNDPAILGPTNWFKDHDGDGYGYADSLVSACSPPSGYVDNPLDCNDNDSTINPMTVWYHDGDGDGYGSPLDSTFACLAPPAYVGNNADCDDSDAAIVPEYWYYDSDSDSYGNPAIMILTCTQPEGYVDNGNDCDDTNPDVYPGAPAKPDGKDNDCDGIIDKVDQTVTLNGVPNTILGNPPVAIHATASSGLKVSFITTGNIQVQDTLLYSLAAGHANITAYQPGNFGYNPSDSVTVSICVAPIKPAISLSGNGTDQVVLTTIPVKGKYIWYLNKEIVAEDTVAYVVKDPGEYTLQIQIDECASEPSNPVNIVITSLSDPEKINSLRIFPNPASDRLYISLEDKPEVITDIHIINTEGKVWPISPGSFGKSSGNFEIELPALNPGLYIIKIGCRDKYYYSGFIKK